MFSLGRVLKSWPNLNLRGFAKRPHSQSPKNKSIEIQHITHVSISENRSQDWRSYTNGWRFGAITCAISASLVFIVNLIITIFWATKAKTGILLEGDCDQIQRTNTSIHFLINILSAILLSSSNYCMQCLLAPTREEIDRAHKKKGLARYWHSKHTELKTYQTAASSTLVYSWAFFPSFTFTVCCTLKQEIVDTY